LHVESQDFGGIDNANMMTPADGESPRMQMYVWGGKALSSSLTIQPLNLSPKHQAPAYHPFSFNVTGQLVLADDGIDSTTDACDAIVNDVAGKIVLVDRGKCTIESKVFRAQYVGAIGVVVANQFPSGLPPMNEDLQTTSIVVGSMGISKADGDTLKQELAAG